MSRTFQIRYSKEDDNFLRPYLYVRLGFSGQFLKHPLPMVIDTGSDHSMFDAKLAEPLGINPALHGEIYHAASVDVSNPAKRRHLKTGQW